MKKIIIADSSKVSLMMISEVFKDHYHGVQVIVANDASEAMKLSQEHQKVDAFVVDFDLHDGQAISTVLRLKELYKETPIFVTAFDRPEVHQAMSTVLAKFEDCRHWLKKPVNSDIVVAVAERFGASREKREQHRVQCSIPSFAEIISKTKKSSILKIKKNSAVSLYGSIEDCSLSGARFRPAKHPKESLNNWNKMLAATESIKAGDTINLFFPILHEIETGSYNKIFKDTASIGQIKETSKTKKQSSAFQSIAGKITWLNVEAGEWQIGIEFNNQLLAKELFEAVVTSKSKKSLQTQSILKTLKTQQNFVVRKPVEY